MVRQNARQGIAVPAIVAAAGENGDLLPLPVHRLVHSHGCPVHQFSAGYI